MVWTVCSMDEQSRAATAAAAEGAAGAAVLVNPFACFHPGGSTSSKGNQPSSAEFLECDYEKNCTPLYR
jgi:hypothetical protein